MKKASFAGQCHVVAVVVLLAVCLMQVMILLTVGEVRRKKVQMCSTLTCQIIVQQILLFFGEKKPIQPY